MHAEGVCYLHALTSLEEPGDRSLKDRSMGSNMDKGSLLTGAKVKLKSRGASPLSALVQMSHTPQGRLLPRV